MIDAFESTARIHPNKVFLTFVDSSGNEVTYTYRQTRLIAAAMARRLRSKGVRRGDCVSVDLPNCPEYVFLALAAAYGSFSLVCLNNRQTSSEKMVRLLEIEREGLRVAYRVDEARAGRLMAAVRGALSGEDRRGTRTIMGAEYDAMSDVVHFAEREAHLFAVDQPALVMFTSGTTGKAKAVGLSWRHLIDSAKASNCVLSARGRGMWQAALPLYHIGGFQMLVRSVENGSPLLLHARFDARCVLRAGREHGATHLSVVDKMLQDLLVVEASEAAACVPGNAGNAGGENRIRTSNGASSGRASSATNGAIGTRAPSNANGANGANGTSDVSSALAAYRCVLIGGGPLNARTVNRALDAGVRLYASYGMTETSSQIANALIRPGFTGGLKLLPGYSAHVVDPDAEGFGRLAVRGPGVFGGYVNAHAPFTVDGYFLTGDTAALYNGAIYVKERTSDMFVSGGENVYPAEITAALLRMPGVADAHVFGVADEVWGRRPVAVVERAAVEAGEDAAKQAGAGGGGPSAVTPRSLREGLAPLLSKLYLPQRFCVVDELPRSGVGKVDRSAVEALYGKSLQVERVVLYHVRLPFKKPFRTARGVLTSRDVVIVEAIDRQGRSGLGECVSFPTDWYLPETLGQDVRVMRELLIPLVCEAAFLHPREVSRLFSAYPEAAAHPIACSAIEMALWDLYGKICGQPLWRQVNEEYARLNAASGSSTAFRSWGAARHVSAGAVIGMGSPAETVEAARACVEAGYRRVKLKIAPGQGLAGVKAVREAFPNLIITLDANQSFGWRQVDELRRYDELGVRWIEEPLAPFAGSSCAEDRFARLAALQRAIQTPVCVDESYVNAAEANRVLEFSELGCIAVKLGKFGGIEPALAFAQKARSLGREIWVGGMYDTGISKRVHAAFQTIPGIAVPGDIGATSRYFDTDVTEPRYEASRGCVALNERGCENGIGCVLDKKALADVLVKLVVVGSGKEG